MTGKTVNASLKHARFSLKTYLRFVPWLESFERNIQNIPRRLKLATNGMRILLRLVRRNWKISRSSDEKSKYSYYGITLC